MRLATIWGGGEEVSAVLVPGSAVPLSGLRDPDDEGWPVDLLSLLESWRLDELRSHVAGLSAGAKRLSARALSHGQVEYGPLYRRRARSGE